MVNPVEGPPICIESNQACRNHTALLLVRFFFYDISIGYGLFNTNWNKQISFTMTEIKHIKTCIHYINGVIYCIIWPLSEISLSIIINSQTTEEELTCAASTDDKVGIMKTCFSVAQNERNRNQNQLLVT